MSRIRSVLVLLVITLLFQWPALAISQKQLKQKEVMTNQDVIDYVKMGLSEENIITKIKQSTPAFDTTKDGLAQLRQAGVSNRIIAVILNPKADLPPPDPGHKEEVSSSTANPSSGGAPPAGNNKDTPYPLPPDKGAYLWDGTTLHLLYQNTVPAMGQNWWRSHVPFVKKKMELQLLEAYAKAHFDQPKPTILVSGLGEVIPGVPAFRWLYVKSGGMLKDRRIVGTYDVGGFFGSVQRVDNEIECEIKKLAEGIYAITPVKSLPDGEYGLVQVPKLAEASSNPSFAPPIWDFGIYAEGRPTEKKK